MKIVERLRLIADEGKILINGEVQGIVVDCAKGEEVNWQEIDKPEETKQVEEV